MPALAGAGTPVRVAGLPSGEWRGSSTPRWKADFDGFAYFVAATRERGQALYATDGTPEGTRLIFEGTPGPPPEDSRYLEFHFAYNLPNIVAGDRLFLVMPDSDRGISLRVARQGGEATTAVPGFNRSSLGRFDVIDAVVSDNRIGTDSHGTFAVTDGTTEGTIRAPADVPVTRWGLVGRYSRLLAPTADGRWFYAAQVDAGAELRAWDPATGQATTIAGSTFGFTDLGELTSFNTGVLFAAAGIDAGAEPWISDGTTTGTVPLGDLAPGAAHSAPGTFRVAAGTAAFICAFPPGAAFSSRPEGELWITDGTASGTQPVLWADGGRVEGASPSSTLSQRHLFNQSNVYPPVISTVDPQTRQVESLPHQLRGNDFWWRQSDDRIWFWGQLGQTVGLFSSDGTVAGTRFELKDDDAYRLHVLRSGRYAFFSSAGADAGIEAHLLDVTTGEASLLADLEADSTGAFPIDVFAASLGGIVVHTLHPAEDPLSPDAPQGPGYFYFLPGKGAAPVRVSFPGDPAGKSRFLAKMGKGVLARCQGWSSLCYWDGDPGHAPEVISSGGGGWGSPWVRANGSVILGLWPSDLGEWNPADAGWRDLMSGCWYPSYAELGGRVLVSCWEGWSDLVEVPVTGPVQPLSTPPDMVPSTTGRLIGTGQFALHAARLDGGGIEPWIVRGPSLERALLADLCPGPGGSNPTWVGASATHVYFTATGVDGGVSLWATDGTERGTQRIMDWLEPEPNTHIGPFVSDGPLVFFGASHLLTGRELWTSTGTRQGTRLVADILPGPVGSAPDNFTPVGDAGWLLFTAWTPDAGRELYRSNGTSTDTNILSEINPGPLSSDPRHLTVSDATLYFSATDQSGSRELWALEFDDSTFRPRGGCGCGSTGPGVATLAAMAAVLLRRRSKEPGRERSV